MYAPRERQGPVKIAPEDDTMRSEVRTLAIGRLDRRRTIDQGDGWDKGAEISDHAHCTILITRQVILQYRMMGAERSALLIHLGT